MLADYAINDPIEVGVTDWGDANASTRRFTTTGAVSATMTMRWHSRRYGVCQSPLIHWSARN